MAGQVCERELGRRSRLYACAKVAVVCAMPLHFSCSNVWSGYFCVQNSVFFRDKTKDYTVLNCKYHVVQMLQHSKFASNCYLSWVLNSELVLKLCLVLLQYSDHRPCICSIVVLFKYFCFVICAALKVLLPIWLQTVQAIMVCMQILWKDFVVFTFFQFV